MAEILVREGSKVRNVHYGEGTITNVDGGTFRVEFNSGHSGWFTFRFFSLYFEVLEVANA